MWRKGKNPHFSGAHACERALHLVEAPHIEEGATIQRGRHMKEEALAKGEASH